MASRGGQIKRFCPQGHDKEAVGRTSDGHCRECRRERAYQRYLAGDPVERRRYMKYYHRKRALKQYGVPGVTYEKLLATQRGCCALCRQKPGKRDLYIDHDHVTGLYRGLLCYKCNTAIGLLHDDPDLVQKAANYLRKSSARLLTSEI